LARDLAGVGSANEAGESSVSQLNRPAHIRGVARRKACLAERMNPLGQIMEVLAVPIPLQPLIQRFAGLALPERLAAPQPARRRTPVPGLVIKSADPAAAHIVVAISPEHVMHLLDQIRCVPSICLIVRSS